MASVGADHRGSENELQRNKKGPLNCRECRRLKIRCDRQVPCGPCIKRGVASLCPDGILASKGSRLILANTEELHKENETLRNRVRDLETALETLQAKHSDEPHPLLAPQLLVTGYVRHDSDDPNSGLTLPAFGSLTLGDDGTSKFYGHTGGAEWFVTELQEDTAPAAGYMCGPASAKNNRLIRELRLMGYGSSYLPEPTDETRDATLLRPYIITKLPPKEDALYLVNVYYDRIAWLYNPVPRTRFFELTFNPCYSNPSDPPIPHHNLALLFSVLALGVLLDLNRQPHDPLAHEYTALSLASLALECIYVNTTCTTVEVMILHYVSLSLSDDPGGPPKAWAVLGTTVKMAEAIGLHRDPAPWGLDEEHVVRRRRLMWELLTVEFWASLGFGRPPTITKSYMDVQMPMDTLDTLDAEPNFPRGKHHYVQSCLMPIIEQVLSTNNPPSYAAILKLDKKVREWVFPENLQLPDPPGSDYTSISRILQRTIMFSTREITLMYLHRSYFANAVMEPPYDPLRSKYARSVLAAYGSACAIIGRMRTLQAHEPRLMERFSIFWSHAFSALVIVASIVSRAPACPLSSTAIVEVDHCVEMFKKANHAYRPRRFMPTVLKLRECAHEAYSLFQQGLWVAPLHEEEPPGLGTSKAVTRYAHRQRTPHSGESAHSGSPAHSGDGSNAESNSEYRYENVQTALEEYIRSWTGGTASSSDHAPNGGPTVSPQANAPIQPPTSDAFLHGILTGNWEMPTVEESVWGQGSVPNRNFPLTTATLSNAPSAAAYDLSPAQNLMEDITFGSAAQTTVPPPSIPQNQPMIYSSPPIVQQQPQLETHAPPAQQAGVGAFNKPYGAPLTGGGDASTNFTHQEAIYNAGIWGDLMQNFGLNQ